MKIGVLSDTHDQGELIRKAVAYFNSQNVALVIHCGDWVSPFSLHFYQGLKAPLKGVFGNNDGDKFRHISLKNNWGLNLEYEDRFLEMEVNHRWIAVFHGDCPGIVEALVRCGKYDVVFHGHTHQKVNQHYGKTLSLNPGSLMQETSRDINEASIAIYDTIEHRAFHLCLHTQ
ncbi:MAG: metallophosphoesterase [Chlamydiae bacterium]|nr:metallophosphoesterase [Chlamydiota bacterium]